MAKSLDISTRRKYLEYLSRRRGTKELDLFLGAFAERNLSTFDSAELEEYEEILTMEDTDLWAWLTSKRPLPKSLNRPVMNLLMKMKYRA
tara:strand:- start:187 stop:456 length:270 start_codon:yes stop_codon:yes gene_type:complete